MKVLRRSLKPLAQAAQDEEVGTQMPYSDIDTKRLFSNLDSTLAHQRGSVAGASILVAGEWWDLYFDLRCEEATYGVIL